MGFIKYTVFLLGFALIFFGSCANRVSPTGGPKDTLVPFVVEVIPRNQSVNYNGKLLIIKFNEWIKEKNLLKELLITPKLPNYKHKIIKDRIEIKFEDTLRSNTTYSFNFRQGLVDITEGNVAVMDTLKKENLKVAFSTGDVIDSMSISGKVIFLQTNLPVKEALISLYRVDDTLQVDKHPPYYSAPTDEKGIFDIRNIAAGSYKVYALADKNNDAFYKEPELIGFLETPIVFNDTIAHIKDITIRIANEDHNAPEILYSRAIAEDFDIEFNEGVIDYQVDFLDEQFRNKITYQLNEKGKVLKFYNLASLQDSIPLKISATDSLGNVMSKETKIAFKSSKPEEKRPRREKTTRKRLNMDVKLPTGTGFEKELKMNFVFDKPVENFDFEKIYYLMDKDTLKKTRLLYLDSTQYYKWNKSKSILSIQKKINFKEQMTLLVDSIAFISVQKDTNDFFKKTFVIKNPKNFGTISGTIKTQETHYLVQLMSDKHEVVAEVKNVKKYYFEYLPAGTYYLRIVIDSNQNGKWDASDVLKNIPAEKMLFFTLPSNGKLRERWDIEGGDASF